MPRNDKAKKSKAKPKGEHGRIGSEFEEWLREERLIDAAYARAKARVEAWRDQQPGAPAPRGPSVNPSGTPRKAGGKRLSRKSV
jgi:hypothetical protein